MHCRLVGATIVMALPSWKHRRRLVYGTYALSVLMVLAGIVAFRSDFQVAVQLIVSGAAMLTVILSAYIGGAVIDDRNHFRADWEDKAHEEGP